MMETPKWLIWASNIGIGVALVGGLFLAVQMIQRLRTRVVVKPIPSLEQLADSARRAGDAAAGDSSIERTPTTAALAPIISRTIGGVSPTDTALLAAQRALGRGRWGEATRAFGVASRDTGSASAALGMSLLAAWQGDATAARTSLERALRLRPRLSASERTLLEAHQRWMAGDISGSDSVFRVLLTTVPDDPTLWYAASFVHAHDGGAIDSALIAYGSPVARSLINMPTRRVSTLGAVPALWRVLQLSPWHEAARLDLARFAALYDDRKLANRLAWGAELYDVEPATRLAMRILGADAKRDSSAWGIALRLAAAHPIERDLFVAARALATSAGLRRPLSLWHAAELLAPLTDASRHSPAIVAIAHAWRGQLLAAVQRPVAALEELHRAAAIDPAIGLPLAAWTVWLSVDIGDSTRRAELATLEKWSGTANDSATSRDWLHPHRGMEAHLRAYSIGLLSATLGDTLRVLSQSSALDRLPPIAGDTALKGIMAAALRAEVALTRGDVPQAMAATTTVDGPLPPLWRDDSPFAGRVHARYRRAFALQKGWKNQQARVGYVAFFSPTLPELSIYRWARLRFDATP